MFDFELHAMLNGTEFEKMSQKDSIVPFLVFLKNIFRSFNFYFNLNV